MIFDTRLRMSIFRLSMQRNTAIINTFLQDIIQFLINFKKVN
jgi:hypothetical protein